MSQGTEDISKRLQSDHPTYSGPSSLSDFLQHAREKMKLTHEFYVLDQHRTL